MSSRDWLFRINDIVDAIKRIESYTTGLNKDTFEANQQAIDAVIRNFEIIGEAASHIPDHIVSKHSHMPWRQMKDMRNILIHEYFGIHTDIIWETILHDLPSLETQLEKIKHEH